MERLLILNPGSTSTKIAIYEDKRQVFLKSIEHDQSELQQFENLIDQLNYRINQVQQCLDAGKADISGLSAVMGRGGIIPNIVTGVIQLPSLMGKWLDDAYCIPCGLLNMYMDHLNPSLRYLVHLIREKFLFLNLKFLFGDGVNPRDRSKDFLAKYIAFTESPPKPIPRIMGGQGLPPASKIAFLMVGMIRSRPWAAGNINKRHMFSDPPPLLRIVMIRSDESGLISMIEGGVFHSSIRVGVFIRDRIHCIRTNFTFLGKLG